MLWPQYGYTCISSRKLQVVLQFTADILNMLFEIVYNFSDYFVMLLSNRRFRINKRLWRSHFIGPLGSRYAWLCRTFISIIEWAYIKYVFFPNVK